MKMKVCNEMIVDVLTTLAIRRRAEEIWLEKGRPSGIDEEIWLEAEQDILYPGPRLVEGRFIDPRIKFLKEKPIGKDSRTYHEFSDRNIISDGERYYYCRYCEGWIEGQMSYRREDTIGPLCGRRGEARGCIRCNNELEFFGMYS